MAVKTSKVTAITLHLEQGAAKTVRAAIAVTKAKNFSTFKIQWQYKTANGREYNLDDSTKSASTLQSKSAPENAVSVSITVTPVDGSGKKAKNRASFSQSIDVRSSNMTVPSTPSVSIVKVDGSVVTVALSISSYRDTANVANYIEFYARKTKFGTNESSGEVIGKVWITTQSVYMQYSGMQIGFDYEFCARAVTGTYNATAKAYTNLVYSQWSDWSSTISGQYDAPTTPCTVTKYRDGRGIAVGITLPKASRTLISEIQLMRDDQDPKNPFSWSKVDSYPKDYIVSLTDESNPKYFTELGPYLYRIRARITGDTEGRGTASKWKEYTNYVKATEKHEAPTTWTTNSKYEQNSSIDLYWMANATDGSREFVAEVKVLVSEDGGNTFTTYLDKTITNNIPLLDDVSAHYYTLVATNPGIFRWQVRTTNMMNPTADDWGEWSTVKEFRVYTKPEVFVTIETPDGDGTAYHFPLTVRGSIRNLGGQELIYYTVKIQNVNRYAEQFFRSTKTRPAMSELYSKLFDASQAEAENDEYATSILPSDVRLENGQEYILTFLATFDSGLTIPATYIFTYDIGSIASDVSITLVNDEYDMETSTIVLKPEVYVHDEESDEFDVYLYRLSYDGESTKLNEEPYQSMCGDTILDPHPTLNNVVYQIMAINKITGQYYFEEVEVDVPDESALIINWDESWAIDAGDETEKELRHAENAYGGNILKLLYNIDRSYQNNKDVVLVEYIGRRNPVSYYGTQQGYSMNWSTDVPYTDYETIELIDQLMAYDGDCYVRESSGKGFWANVKVSYSHKSNEMKYAVTIAVTKVEGGA